MLCRWRVYTVLPFYFFLRGSRNPFPDTGFRAVGLKFGEGGGRCQGDAVRRRFLLLFRRDCLQFAVSNEQWKL
jgi:hypothetical protein